MWQIHGLYGLLYWWFDTTLVKLWVREVCNYSVFDTLPGALRSWNVETQVDWDRCKSYIVIHWMNVRHNINNICKCVHSYLETATRETLQKLWIFNYYAQDQNLSEQQNFLLASEMHFLLIFYYFQFLYSPSVFHLLYFYDWSTQDHYRTLV